MAIDYGFIKLGLSIAGFAKTLLSPDEETRLGQKILSAIDKAKTRFHEKYGECFGDELSSFLVRSENEEAILKSIIFSSKFPDPSTILPEGFDGAPSVTIDAIRDFLALLVEEIHKDYELDKHFSQKELMQLLPLTQSVAEEQRKQSVTLDNVNSTLNVISKEVMALPSQLTNYNDSLTEKDRQQQINYSKELLENKKAYEALNHLKWLEKTYWATASSLVKFRIITNMGAAHMALGDNSKAAEHLIRAQQYNPDDELAACNAAQAFLIISDSANARKQAQKALTLNPLNATAYAVITQLGPISQTLEEFIKQIPPHFMTSSEVPFAISILYHKKDDLDKAQEWLEKAVANDTKGWSDVRAALGGLLIEKAMVVAREWVYDPDTLPDYVKETAAEGVKFLSEAWDKVAKTDVAQAHSEWVYNRSIGHFLLGEIPNAIRDIETAISIKSDNIVYLKILSRYTLIIGDAPRTLEILEKIGDSPEVPEAPLLKSEILKKTDIQGAERELVAFLYSSGEKDIELIRGARRALIRIYLEQNKWADARNLLEESRSLDPEYILHIVDWSIIDRHEFKETGSAEALISLVSKLQDTSVRQILLAVADELYARKQFELASGLYEKMVPSPPRKGALLHRILISYYDAGFRKQALELSLKVLEEYCTIKVPLEIASSILIDIGDLPKARQLYLNSLASIDDYEIALRMAVLDYHDRNMQGIREFLQRPIPLNELHPNHGAVVAKLLVLNGETRKGIDILYELRRKFYSDKEIHGAYLVIFHFGLTEKEAWLNPKIVAKDVAVNIKDEGGVESWYVIEERENADISRRELALNHPLALKLLNKKVGDKVLLSDTPVAPCYGYINAITSKYVYALRDSHAAIGKIFESVPGIQHVHLGVPTKDSPSVTSDAIKTLIANRVESMQEIEQKYIAGQLSLGTVSQLSGLSIIDAWRGLIARKGTGIICSSGAAGELETAVNEISNTNTLVFELTSILTIFALKLQQVIPKITKRLVIAQSTVDELNETIELLNVNDRRHMMSIAKIGEKYVRQEISPKKIKKQITYLNNIVHWCRKNCAIVPCYEALEQRYEEKQKLDNAISKSFVDSLLLARQEKGILISDDHVLKLWASENKIANAWSHALITWCYKVGLIREKALNSATLDLVKMQYKYLNINRAVMCLGAEQSEWKKAPPFTLVTEVLNGNHSELVSASAVALESIMDIWVLPIDKDNKRTLIKAILEQLFTFRPPRVIVLFARYFEDILRFRPCLRSELREITMELVTAGANK